jgi:hypothetical protein
MVFAQNFVDIAASPETVWAQLVDCVAWPAWYKHCTDVSVLRGGTNLSAGGKFRFKTLGFYFEPEIATFEPHRCWYGRRKAPQERAALTPGISSRCPAAAASSPKSRKEASYSSFCGHARVPNFSSHTKSGFVL